MKTCRGSAALVATMCVVLAPNPALAHSSLPGIKGFYVGLLHPFSSPAQALLMLGLGVLAAGFGPPRSSWVFATFLGLSLFGALIGAPWMGIDTALFGAACLASALAALAPGRLVGVALAITALSAALIGAASIPDPGPARDVAFTLSGSIVGANLGFLYLWGAVRYVTARLAWPWVPIGLRIIAAWIGAIAMLMLSLGYADLSAAG